MEQTAFRLALEDFELLDDVVEHQFLGVGNRSDALRYILRQYAKAQAGYDQLVVQPVPDRQARVKALKAAQAKLDVR